MSCHEKQPLLGLPLSNEKSNECTTIEMCQLDPQLSVDHNIVEFSVGAQEERIKCRRLTLKSSSPVFGSILTDLSNNGKNHEVIELPDVQPEHFRNFIKYVEEDEHFTSFTIQEVQEVFKIAKRYHASLSEDKCRQFLQRTRCVSNAITIYQAAQFLDEQQLEYDTYSFIIDNFAEILETKDFVNLSHANLCTFLKLDEIVVSELKFFRAICRWAEAECSRIVLDPTPTNIRLVLQSAIHLIRFPLMPLSDFSMYVKPKKILSTEEINCMTQFLLLKENERQRADISKIYPFNYKRRGIAPPKTYTVCFYDCLIYNSDMWQGKWNCNLIKVNHPVEVVSFGFDGPIVADAMYDVKIKLIVDNDENGENVENECVASKHEVVMAKKERTFYVKFDNPYKIKPNVFYRACYALTGPKTIWGVQPKNEVSVNNVVFTYKFVDGQLPEIRFTLPTSSSFVDYKKGEKNLDK